MRLLLCLVVVVVALTSGFAQADGLAEVNAQRARAGLPPLTPDAEFQRFAQGKAEWQAARGICLSNGFNGHEGPAVPTRGAEGTGHASHDWGWVTCRMWTRGSWPAGAGLAIGTDGKRYMCLVIRCPQNTPEGRGVMLKDTSRMSNPSTIGRINQHIQREPIGRPFIRKNYPMDGRAARTELESFDIIHGISPADLKGLPCPNCGKVH